MQEIFTRLYIICHEYYPVTQLEISNVIVPRMSVSKDISDFNIQAKVCYTARRRNCTSSQIKRYKKIYFQTDRCSCYLPVEVYPKRFI